MDVLSEDCQFSLHILVDNCMVKMWLVVGFSDRLIGAEYSNKKGLLIGLLPLASAWAFLLLVSDCLELLSSEHGLRYTEQSY